MLNFTALISPDDFSVLLDHRTQADISHRTPTDVAFQAYFWEGKGCDAIKGSIRQQRPKCS
jgi:hypothetical protein